MAEFVNQRLEDMLTELEQMKRMELYTPGQIRDISKKRTDFEYKLKRQTKTKEDFLSYIAYECLLLEDIAVKRKKMNNMENKAHIEFAMTKRIKSLYKDLVHRFPSDLELWLSYIVFCKNASISQHVTSILEELLQVHGDKPRVWQIASRWELDEMDSVSTARNFILKGIQRHPSCGELYIEALKLELCVTKTLENNQDEKVTQVERMKIFIKNALKHITDIAFLVEVCTLLGKHECAEDIRLNLISVLWTDHSDKIKAWEYIAKCALQMRNVDGFNWKEFGVEYKLNNCSSNLQNFCNVFETAITKIPTKDACDVYIKNAMKLCTFKEYDSILTLQIIKRALTIGHEMKKLSEEQYGLWLDVLICNRASEEEIDKALEDACKSCPTSEFLWTKRLKRSKNNQKKMIEIFKEAEENLPADKVTPLWIVLLTKTNKLSALEKLHNDSMRLSPEVVKTLKPKFLEQFYKCSGLIVARKMYKTMAITPPFTIELHKLMMSIEKRQMVPTYSEWKSCHENSTRQFGKTNPQVWLDFIQFEKEQDHAENCGALYTRACATLDKKHVDKFIVDYTLNKHKV